MNAENPVAYLKPEHSEEEKLLRHHRFEIKEGDTVVSAAEIHYRSKPIPFYQVSSLYTEYTHAGKGYASAIMDKIETFLKERKKPGILVDTIMSDVPEVQGMYERRGWHLIDEYGRRVFNLPEDIDPKIFVGYEMRGVDVFEDI